MKESHMERTAGQPREATLHTVVVRSVEQVNDDVRVIRLGIPEGASSISYLPGQFLDVFCPGVDKAGGFTPTSPPSRARRRPAATATAAVAATPPYIELAVQRSPGNPAAAFLWRGPPTEAPDPDSDSDSGSDGGEELPGDGGGGGGEKQEAKDNDDDNDGSGEKADSTIVGAELRVRAGGSFVYPPPGIIVSLPSQLRRVVFVAGGMGANPLVCMAAHLAEQGREAARLEVRFLYSVGDPALRRRRGRGRKTKKTAETTGEEEEEEKGGAGPAGDGARTAEEAAGTRVAAKGLLFIERLAALFVREQLKGKLSLFLTPGRGPQADGEAGATKDGESKGKPKVEEVTGMDNRDADGVVSCNEVDVPFRRRRISKSDLVEAIGPDKRSTVVYVCGVPTMTDEFVAELTSKDGIGMEPHRVLYEKWW